MFIRDRPGSDLPIVFLHGGWGYGFYPVDDALARIPNRFVIPDRTGYGASVPPVRQTLPREFHAMYARETVAVLDELGISRCIVWGHSDGAVIAVHVAALASARCAGVVLEALHLDREKPRSREFFTRMAKDPDAFGERVATRLEAEHGPGWRTIIRADGEAWLAIAASPELDLFDGHLGELRAPTLVLHGSADPRTEPGEIDRLRREVAHAEIHMIDGGQHAPHSERATAATCTELVARFAATLSASAG